MDRDAISEAFARWKIAQDAYFAAERRLFGIVGTRPHRFPVEHVQETDPLFIEVQAKRAHAEKLLLDAMKLLHEQRHPPDTPSSGT